MGLKLTRSNRRAPVSWAARAQWLEIEEGKIRSIFLLTDHVRWPPVLAELTRRSAR
jgi:hypothetical protein